MPYLRMTEDQYVTWYEDAINKSTSYSQRHHGWYQRENEKPPKAGWKFLWMPIDVEQAIQLADNDPDRVLYADNQSDAELLLDELYPPPANNAGMTYHARTLINSNSVLVLFDQLILPDVPHDDEDEEWETLGRELMGRGRVYYFSVPDDWRRDGRRRAFGNIVVDCQEQTLEYSPKRVKAMEAGKRAAETRKGRVLPADAWKPFFKDMRSWYVNDGPLNGVVHSVSWAFQVSRGTLWGMIKGYQAINDERYRYLSTYYDFMAAAQEAVPYMRKSAEKTNNSDELELVKWIEAELAWAEAEAEKQAEAALS